MYVLPLILGVAIFAVFLFGTVGIGLTAVKFKSMGNNSNNKVLSKEFRNQLIQAYNKAFSAMNLKAMTDMLTDYMYYTTQCTLEVLKKLSIRKEVEFTPDPEKKVCHFMDVQCDDEYIYAIYYGREPRSNEDLPDQLYVFDWDGDLVDHCQLPVKCTALQVGEDDLFLLDELHNGIVSVKKPF